MIRLEGVTRRFRSPAGVRLALDGVDLTVAAGEVFGVVGRSGAGKSTLVRTLNLLERPDAGRVWVDDQDLMGLNPAALRAARRRIGMIFQHFNLLHSRTIRDNIALPLVLDGRSRVEIASRVDELMERLGLIEHARKHPAQLSGGQKQRVGIARALACEPSILLCDEATSALDPETTEEILALLDQLNLDLGLTLVLITHEMEVVRRVCDKVAVMEAGKIVETGATADVFLKPQTQATRSLLAEGESRTATPRPVGGTVARLVFRGERTFEPVLSRVSRETGVDHAILAGRIGRFRDQAYGQLEVAFAGGDPQVAIARLRAEGVEVEVVS
ncbi:methionine import ATP-binding protein MetN [Brevundimonas intermedia]|uniref:Methionine import ATP-binding protein MetN n=1 Tax=Brevundimonas intermedia TaxID=74315 RepID=A0ABQ5T7B7_9CAUL|nr:ATP-binding cassette domain-containing protein [Brevundimonas intermedia]GLK47666.1 methionine import ATP-binding protein MetN [Brevundimonas intermedia]